MKNNELKGLFEKIKMCDNKEDKENIFEEMYLNMKKTVYKIAYGILKNNEDSEDVMQKVFIKIYSVDKERLPKDNEFSWLYTVTKNESIAFAKKKNEYIDIDKIYEIEDKNDGINELIEIERFNKIIHKLNELDKQIVSLKILSEFSFEEISRLLNKPTSTIKWRYYKALYNIELILSNLSLFIITFVLGSKMAFKKYIKEKTTENKNENKDENISKNEIENNDIDSLNQEKNVKEETKKSEELSDTDSAINNENNVDIKEEMPIESNVQNVNYNLEISFVGISMIFLIIAIVFIKRGGLKNKKIK